jgi:hypothetical protein
MEAVAAVRSAFPAGTNLTYEGITATIKSCGPKPGMRNEAHYTVPVILQFYSRIPR